MKRVLAYILVFTMALCLCACGGASASGKASSKEAKPFELRSGIHFGDTIDEVKEKETSLRYVGEDSNNKYVYFVGNIAGFDDSTAYFFYDNNNRVEEVAYAFSSVWEPDTIKRAYETIYNSCVRQYGEPLSRGTEYPVAGREVSRAYNGIEKAISSGGKGELLGYSQWVVLGDDGNNTKIDLVHYMATTMVGTPAYYVYVNYTPFQQSTVNDIDSEF